MPRFKFEERLEWRTWVTPKPLESKPIHRWYVFPHSFTSELVHALIDEWGLTPDDHILDPFCGAGTTILAAKERGIPATGYDISPLAVLATTVKVANYNLRRLRVARETLDHWIDPSHWNGTSRFYPKLVEQALPGKLLGAFDAIWQTVGLLPNSETERDFFRLSLLSIIPEYSRAIATGGWLSWVDNKANVRSLERNYFDRIDEMLSDLADSQLRRTASWKSHVSDARSLPGPAEKYSAVITSPPYPNRHDYTRVFGVELMFGFLDWEGTRKVRYQSIQSHPESKPQRASADNFRCPARLKKSLRELELNVPDKRIARMMEGYFFDMHLVLRRLRRISSRNAKFAFVLGNAQYAGVAVPVDEFVAGIAQNLGFEVSSIGAVRYRGNSAQQMATFGRIPSRESVVLLKFK